MQEFGTMCKEREAEVVKGVLPYWPRIYCKISLVSIEVLKLKTYRVLPVTTSKVVIVDLSTFVGITDSF